MTRRLLQAALLLAVLPGAALAADQHLYLEVVVNGRDTGKIASFVEGGGSLLATRKDLADLGLIIPGAAPAKDDDALVDLRGLPHLSYQLDERTQTLQVSASRGGVRATRLSVQPTAPDDLLPAESGTGIVLNYDIVGVSSNGQNLLNGLFDARAFSPYGVLDSSFLAATAGQRASVIRLDTTYTYSAPDVLRRYKIGDIITGGLSWTRPVRLGGVQITTDFALRPDLITFPLPSIKAEAAVPSTVDVLINGVRQLSQHVGAGPFDVPQIPVVSGSGEVSLVMKDVLGRQITETLPFYASPDLLTPGLSSFSTEIGAIRRNYGVGSDDYSALAGEASLRHGFLPWLTIEAHGEGTSDLGMGGAGAAIGIGALGVISFAGAASTSQGRRGAQYAVGFQHISPIFSFSASTQISNVSFRDVASVSGDPAPRMMTRASVGTSLGNLGSIGVSYVGIADPREHAQLITASYSRRVFGNVYAFATGFHDFARGGSTGVLFSLSIPFGQRSSASVSTNMDKNGAAGLLQASQSAANIGDIGWQMLAQTGQQNHQFGELDYKSPWNRLGVGVDRFGAQTTMRATADGALAIAGGGVFASNSIPDSFAVVDTDGTPGVRVTQENRVVERTGPSGLVLIPDLRSYEPNRIGINPDDVPADADVRTTQRVVRPQDRSGVVVRFPIHASQGALLQMVAPDGAAIPVGSTAVLTSTKEDAPIGYDGETFLRGLSAHNSVTVTEPDGSTCRAAFNYHPARGVLPRIGPITCRSGVSP